MIRFVVISVVRRSTSAVDTMRYTYPEGKEPVATRKTGAEWEEVEFSVEQEEKPAIAISNVHGDALLVGQPIKLILNNPDLFGTFKVGDFIPFAPLIEAPSGDPQPSPSRTESGKGG